MSTFTVEVVKLGKLGKHPNADSLSITQIFGQNVIVRTGDFVEDELVVYVPYDAVVPLTDPKFAFLKKDSTKETMRIKPVRLRGIYSEGIVIKADSGMVVGQNVADLLGVVKYEEPDEFMTMNSDNEADPGFMPSYEIESYFKYKHLFEDGEEVIATEKIHGCNGRFGYINGRMWVGSHNRFKKFDERNVWWKAAIKYDLENKMKMFPGIAFYGEVYGYVQDLHYSVPAGETIRLRFFDAYDTGLNNGTVARRLDHSEFEAMIAQMGLETVPVLYRGPLDRSVVEPLRTGISTLDNKTIREGIVLRPVKERSNPETRRTVLKLVSENYKLRRGKTSERR